MDGNGSEEKLINQSLTHSVIHVRSLTVPLPEINLIYTLLGSIVSELEISCYYLGCIF